MPTDILAMLPITTCFVAGSQYLLHPVKLGTIQETIKPEALIPVTLLTTEEIFGDLEGVLHLFDTVDDVFNPEFGSILVEKTGNNTNNVLTDARLTYHMDLINTLEGLSELPSGPYFLHGPNLHQAWRLYDDEYGAFTFGVIPDDVDQPKEYQPVTSSSVRGDSVTVPVPSRLYYPKPSLRKPLSGVRVSLGDTISLKGTHTTFSSRAWKSLYKDPSNVTAEYAQELLDQGAIIVGKTKTTQFGTGAEWVDEQAPWSARGDGYQRIQGASVGAASAIIGYEWLDHSVGVDDDTIPTENGIYSLIHTASLLPSGINTVSRYDGARFFSRSLKGLLHSATSQETEADKDKPPSRIIIPTDLLAADQYQKIAMVGVALTLEELSGTKVEYIDTSDVWDKDPPVEAPTETMQEYMSNAPFRSWCYEYTGRLDKFRTEYRQKFHREPFVENTVKNLLDTCEDRTEEEHHEDEKRLEIYREWFHDKVMSISTAPNANENSIVVLPCGDNHVKYRHDLFYEAPSFDWNITSSTLAPVLGATVLSFPVAQIPYESHITKTHEYLPLCVSVLSLHGDDKSVIRWVEKVLQKHKVPTKVEVGRTAFPVKESDHSLKHPQNPLLVQGSWL